MADFSTVFLDFDGLEVDGFSFLGFLSGTVSGREVIDADSLTAPITDTVAGSTKVPSLLEESSAFFASYFSFFNL